MNDLKNSVIIIESPNKIKKISSMTGAKVFATAGHFLELKDIEVSKGYAPVFDYNESKKKNIFYYIASCKDKKVYIATDPDREGYGIGYMFYNKIKNIAKEVYRAEFHEITQSGIQKGIKEAVLFVNTNKKYYEAFLGRRVSDMFIGYSLSPYISKQLNIKALSAGRVQTPALSLIVKREEEIEKFDKLSPEEKINYALCANIEILGNEYIIKHIDENAKEIKFDTQAQAQEQLDKLCECQKAVLKSIEKKQSEQNPPKPFTTSKLLKAGSKALNISTKEVQEIAQKLFEAGLITYIRTDSEFISEEYLKAHQKFYEPIYQEIYQYSKYEAGKNSQAEAHEAIRITHVHTLEELKKVCAKENITKENEIKLYEMIFKNTLTSQMKPAVYENTILKFNIKLTSFQIKFKNLIDEGYLKAFQEEKESNHKSDTQTANTNDTLNANQEEDPHTGVLRINTNRLKENDLFDVTKIFIKNIAKTAPKRYVESEFIEVLERNGIGRPSTYATYLPILQNKEYINIEGKKREIAPTVRGKNIIEFFKTNHHNWILDIDFTKKMESKLDEITLNKANYLEFMQELHTKLGDETGNFGKQNKEKKESKKIPPSLKQIEFSKAIAEKLKLDLPKDLENDCYVAKDFINKHIAAFNKTKQNQKN
ncbi:type IA DNA topoisomerase [Helicobacter sp. 11S03491-1]|uniref:type IA DNA topoisomerase n=1 Tax=Helicobacter sp. 11S03491-1 TaxID=1476196 RepID=UPI000BA7772E|nr:type IA DNA topoisomerase [Helicobacter sp. 11S03491-1]PAF42166.1 hypothetical protein BKH45_04255 [Helicobacter sp. 11S03491-1]